MKLFRFQKGYSPLLISNPHSGTFIPPEIAETMTEAGLERRDTDWFLSKIYDFPAVESAAMISANTSRYVIDLNRPTDDTSLYPDRQTTSICPTITFDQRPIYQDGLEPDQAEIEKRIEHYWQPYHDQLLTELDRLIEQFGFAVLLDVHSVAEQVPFLFEGKIPDFNFGTHHGKSCGAALQEIIENFADSIQGYSHVINGRFIGGYITRHYGSLENVHAVQLELNRATYLDEEDLSWDLAIAQDVVPVVESFVVKLMKWVENHPGF
ncbi:MAG: N-formylglutamate deformylase [Planctomycetota bacterium]